MNYPDPKTAANLRFANVLGQGAVINLLVKKRIFVTNNNQQQSLCNLFFIKEADNRKINSF
jgi:hypothetical protein